MPLRGQSGKCYLLAHEGVGPADWEDEMSEGVGPAAWEDEMSDCQVMFGGKFQHDCHRFCAFFMLFL